MISERLEVRSRALTYNVLSNRSHSRNPRFLKLFLLSNRRAKNVGQCFVPPFCAETVCSVRGVFMSSDGKERVVASEIANRDQPIEETVYRLLAKCAGKLEAELNRLLRQYDLTTATYDILRILQSADSTGQSCGDISTQLIAEVPDMTRLLDRLDRLGYVARKRSTEDRRVITVSITDEAKRVLSVLSLQVRDFYIRELGHLGSEKLGEFASLLGLLLGAEKLRDFNMSFSSSDIPVGERLLPEH